MDGLLDADPVIADVDAALIALLREALPEGTPVGTETVAAEGVLALLHDVREDTTARAALWRDEHDERGRVVARVPPARRYRMRYLIVAVEREAEHAVLDSVLTGLAGHTAVPAAYLSRQLAAAGVTVQVAPPELDVVPVEWWSARGLHPACPLDIVLTAPCLLPAVHELAPIPAIVELGATHGGTQSAAMVATGRPVRRIREDGDG